MMGIAAKEVHQLASIVVVHFTQFIMDFGFIKVAFKIAASIIAMRAPISQAEPAELVVTAWLSAGHVIAAVIFFDRTVTPGT